MDAVIKFDPTCPSTVLGSIKDCLEYQINNVQDQADLDSLKYVFRMVSALHTMFSTQQPYPLYNSLKEFIEVAFQESCIFSSSRFKLSKEQSTIDMMCNPMNLILNDSFYNLYRLANTCASSIISASSSDKINSYETHPDKKKDEEEDIKFGDFYDYVVDEEEDGTHVRLIFNKEKYDKYWTQFKAREKKYGFDKAKFIIRGL